MTARPLGVTLLSAFFVFGALMSGLAAMMLLAPGTALDGLWQLNPRAHESLAGAGGIAIYGMMAVCASCLITAVGLWKRLRLGYRAAIYMLAVNFVGDATNFFLAHDWRTLIGLPVGGLMIAYLVRQRRTFR